MSTFENIAEDIRAVERRTERRASAVELSPVGFVQLLRDAEIPERPLGEGATVFGVPVELVSEIDWDWYYVRGDWRHGELPNMMHGELRGSRR